MAEIKFKGKKFEKLKAFLKRENAKFGKLTKKEQRLEIAHDVIALLKAERIMASSTYISFEDGADLEPCYASEEDDYGDRVIDPAMKKIETRLLLDQLPACEVCGIGSLFVAAVRKHDKLPISNFLDLYNGRSDRRDSEARYLKKWFDQDELYDVERFFEADADNFSEQSSPIRSQNDKSIRLVMIMENIISNGGHFKPSVGRHKDPVGSL